MSHLLQTQTTYSKQLNHLILQLNNSNNIDFVGQFFSSGKETGRFVSYINLYWPQLFEEIIQESNFSNSLKKQFALASVYFSSDADLSEIDSKGALSDYIANCSDFLQIDAPKTARIIEVLESLKIKFVAVEYGTANAELWTAVYSHNLYEINIEMLNTILECQYHIPPCNDYNHKNFSLILSRPDEPLVAYIQNNIEQYVSVLLSNCGGSISDNEDAITYILSDKTISDENKTTYIEYLQSAITSLSSIKDSKWWAPIIQHSRLIYSIENVLCYFFGGNSELDDVLVQFINNFGKKFSFKYDVINEEFGENSGSAFLDAVIQCNSLNNDKYSAILKSLSGYYESFKTEGIDEDKIDILIDIGAIYMFSDTLIFMRENYQDNLVHFIEENIQTYTDEVLSESNFLLDEALELLKSDIEDTHKIRLLKFTDEPISVVNQKYSAEVESYILEHNFDTNDLPYLLQHYNDLYELSKEITEQLAIRYINDITSNEYVLSQALLLNLLSSQSLDSADKLRLFSQVLLSLGETQCKRCLEILGLNDFLSLFDGKRPTFEINDVHNDILSTFKNNGWITKFEEENGSGCYRAFGRKRHYKR